MIPATYIGIQPVSHTTDPSVVATSCDPVDGRQERRRVAPEASDGPILPPIGGIAKQAGFAERRYGDQLHGSDRGLRWSFVSIDYTYTRQTRRLEVPTLDAHPSR